MVFIKTRRVILSSIVTLLVAVASLFSLNVFNNFSNKGTLLNTNVQASVADYEAKVISLNGATITLCDKHPDRFKYTDKISFKDLNEILTGKECGGSFTTHWGTRVVSHDFYGITLTLTANVDLSDIGFQGLGNLDSIFRGTFDGNGCKVTCKHTRDTKGDITALTGMKITDRGGFFNSQLISATIRNLELDLDIAVSLSPEDEGFECVSGALAYVASNGSKIQNCKVTSFYCSANKDSTNVVAKYPTIMSGLIGWAMEINSLQPDNPSLLIENCEIATSREWLGYPYSFSVSDKDYYTNIISALHNNFPTYTNQIFKIQIKNNCITSASNNIACYYDYRDVYYNGGTDVDKIAINVTHKEGNPYNKEYEKNYRELYIENLNPPDNWVSNNSTGGQNYQFANGTCTNEYKKARPTTGNSKYPWFYTGDSSMPTPVLTLFMKNWKKAKIKCYVAGEEVTNTDKVSISGDIYVPNPNNYPAIKSGLNNNPLIIYGQEATAVANPGYKFTSWNREPTCYKANFELISYDIAYQYQKEGESVNTYTDEEVASKGWATTYTIEDYYALGTPADIPGYTFQGWYIGNDKYTAISNMTGKLTLTAKFAVNKSTLTIVASGGTYSTEVKSGQVTRDNSNKYIGESCSILEITLNPRTGYTFAGWTLSPASNGSINSTTNMTIEYTYALDNGKNATLTASWSINMSTLTIDPDGGSVEIRGDYDIDITTAKSLTMEYQESITLSTPVRAGYKFIGWAQNPSTFTNGMWYSSSSTYIFGENANTTETLTASWEVEIYNINYLKEVNSNTPVEDETLFSSCPATYSAESEQIGIRVPTIDGYEVLFWTIKIVDKYNNSTTLYATAKDENEGNTINLPFHEGTNKYYGNVILIASYKNPTFAVQVELGEETDSDDYSIKCGETTITSGVSMEAMYDKVVTIQFGYEKIEITINGQTYTYETKSSHYFSSCTVSVEGAEKPDPDLAGSTELESITIKKNTTITIEVQIKTYSGKFN